MSQMQLINNLIKEEIRFENAAEQWGEHQPELFKSEAVSSPPYSKDNGTDQDKIWEFEEMRRINHRPEPYVNYLAAPGLWRADHLSTLGNLIQAVLNRPSEVSRILDQNIRRR